MVEGIRDIESKLKSSLAKNGAPLVELNDMKGVLTLHGETVINTLYVSMGECTGDEFEAIKQMRQDVEIEHKINIINVIISL